jgi:hypothetical protein
MDNLDEILNSLNPRGNESSIEQIKMSDEEYRSLPHIAQSDILLFLESPLDYYLKKIAGLSGVKATNEMNFGSLLHCKVFEPNLFDQRYIICNVTPPNSEQELKLVELLLSVNPISEEEIVKFYSSVYSIKNKSSDKIRGEALERYKKLTDYLEFVKGKGNKIVISLEDHIVSESMINSLRENKVADTFIFNPKNFNVFNEFVILWKYLNYNFKLKSKLDRVLISVEDGYAIIVDYKTTKSKNKKECIKAVRQYKYYVQMSFYKTALQTYLYLLYGKKFKVDHLLMFQRSSFPFNVMPVRLHDSDIDKGFDLWTSALKEIQFRNELNKWEDIETYSEDGIINLRVFEDEIEINGVTDDNNDGPSKQEKREDTEAEKA